jgi:processive 1,2-diacylglycerol beta-glucosyltransferase
MNNPKKQKLLLISCSGGMGHIRAAEALKTHAEKYYPEITCEHFNAAEYSGWFLNTSLVKTYEFLIKNHPKVFGALFKLADTTMGKKYIELHHPLLRKSGEPLIEAIERFGPDRIIVTHPIIMPLLEKLSNPPPIDVVVTDYYANQIWLHPNIRHLFVATEEMKTILISRHSSIIVSGIPLNPVFFEEKNIEDLQKKYQIVPERPTILVMSGGQGLIDTSTLTEHLLRTTTPLNIIAISGKGNKVLFKKLKEMSSTTHRYFVIEFTSLIDEYMRLSNLIITKPGGLTVTECLYLKKPMILINPIPGQEEANARYIEQNKFGVLTTNTEEVFRATQAFLNTTLRLHFPHSLSNSNTIILETF